MTEFKIDPRGDAWIDIALWNALCEVFTDTDELVKMLGEERVVEVEVTIAGKPYDFKNLVDHLEHCYKAGVAKDAVEMIHDRLGEPYEILEVINDAMKSHALKLADGLDPENRDWFLSQLNEEF